MKRNTILMFIGVGMLSACNNPEGGVEKDTLADATADSAVVYDDERAGLEADGVEIIDVGDNFWAGIDWEAPVVDDPDLKGSDMEMRSSDGYNIYRMDDRVLFDTDKAQIRSEGEQKLKQIADEIKNLPPNGPIRVFGHADARAGEEYNKQLSEERANAVKNWLQNQGGIDEGRISIEAMGEEAPRASNETAKGRQQNRRVAIVVVTREQ
jgi:outer membrane protein OmpA-like peptidoglycan-associated protein